MKDTVFATRRAAVSAKLDDRSVMFLLAGQAKQKTLDQDYPFEINRNFYYLTGIDLPHCILLISKIGGEIKETLFIDRPDPYLERYHGKMPDIADMQEKTGIATIEYLDRFDWVVSRLLARNYFENLYFDFQKRDLDFTIDIENALWNRLSAAHPYLRARSISRTICNMRRVKSAEEREAIENAIAATKKGIELLMANLRPGVNEDELQGWFEFGIRSAHAEGNGFNPIIAGGKNSVYLHYDKNNQFVSDGEVLLIDVGAGFGHYSADISRTFPVNGKFTEEQKFYYNVVLYGQDKLAEWLKPGEDINRAVDISRAAMAEMLMEAGKISDPSEMKTLLPHGISHGIGLDVHDVGDDPYLVPGMIVTMEPGIYLPEKNLGIRIEDDVIITETGCEFLSRDIPRTVEEIEEFMQNRK